MTYSRMKLIGTVPLVAGVALWLSATATTQQLAQPPAGRLPAQALQQIAALQAEKARRTPAQRKVSSHLLRAEKIARGEPVASGVTITRRSVNVDAAGRVSVDLLTLVTPNVLGAIEASGGAVVNSVPGYGAIRALIPLSQIETIAALPEVQFIRPADQMITNQARTAGLRRPAGTDGPITNKVNTSQGDIAHRAALARSLFGVDGTGIGIGVLSDGVDTLAARQASGDLPAVVTVLPGQAGTGDEGTAMLEIVHDLAPNATLFFATADPSQAQFATNIQALCTAGARVIVDDVFYVAEAAFQDGTVAQGVNAAVANGCFHFSSAGNQGNLNDGSSGVWEGDFLAAASTPPGAVGTAHNFGGGANSNALTVDPPFAMTLHWSDPLGGSANDYDLYLFNSALTVIEALSDDIQNGTQNPFEFIDSGAFDDVNLRLVVVRFTGSARYLHMNTIGGRLGIPTSGQTAGHGAAASAFGVAAVNVGTAGGGAFTGGPSNPVETFSSDGFRRIFYNPNGSVITPGNVSSTGGLLLQKPDLTAADCVSTATPGFSTFCGTSAAAPHAAAIAALMLQAAGGPSSLTLAQMRAAISARSLDIEAAGVDRDSGSGIMDALGVIGRTHPAFTDSTLTPGSTIVRAVHIIELRNRVNAQRVRCGLSQFAFTDVLTPGVTPIRAVHVEELRTALNAAYSACLVTPPSYIDPSLASVAVKAIHITQLRNAVIALE